MAFGLALISETLKGTGSTGTNALVNLRAELTGFNKRIQEADLDAQTRRDLLGRLANLNLASRQEGFSVFEGDSGQELAKFRRDITEFLKADNPAVKARIAVEEQQKLARDLPGRKQTLLTNPAAQRRRAPSSPTSLAGRAAPRTGTLLTGGSSET